MGKCYAEKMTTPEGASGVPGSPSRDPNLELLRIISILMIVAGHIMNVFIGGVLKDVETYTVNYYLGWLLQAYVVVGVNCFVLLSGYFMCRQQFKLKRIVLLWLELAVYSIGIHLVLCILGIQSLSPITLVKGLLPITTNSVWFVTVYVLLCCVAPFLNLLISAVDKRQHLGCLCALLLVFCLWATAAGFGDFTGVAQGFSLTWFVILYLIAAYIRKYGVPERRPRVWMLLFLATGALLATTKPVISIVTELILGEAMFSGAFYIYNSPFVLAESIFLFLFCRDLKIKNGRAGRVICSLAPLSLGVQILHAYSGLKGLWVELLHPRTYANAPMMLPYVLFCTAVIYAICVAIDALRQFLFRPIKRMTWPDRLQAKGTELVNWLSQRI